MKPDNRLEPWHLWLAAMCCRDTDPVLWRDRYGDDQEDVVDILRDAAERLGEQGRAAP